MSDAMSLNMSRRVAGVPVFRVAAASLAFAAGLRLAHGFWRLTVEPRHRSAIDLKFRHAEITAWFSGETVYGRILTADYPPASYVILWPFMHWDVPVSRWVWALVTAGLLVWFGWLLARECGLRTLEERICVALLPLAGTSIHGMLATGQVSLLAVTLVTAGLLTILRARSWRGDAAGAALVVASLVKPTIAAPLVWVAVLVPGRLRPAAFIFAGYAALTVVAASFQADSVVQLLQDWLVQRDEVDVQVTLFNAQKLLTRSGLEAIFLPVALGLFVLTGWWVYRHRRLDPWILIGMAAIVARFWTYHRSFDDLLMVLPMIALIRIASQAESPRSIQAWCLVVALAGIAVAPRGILDGVETAIALLNIATAVIWTMVALFLLAEAERRTRLGARDAPTVAATLG
jgi:hypothetical protein